MYTAHTQKKISNALSTFCRQYLVKNVCLRLTFEGVETQLWLTKAVRQRIPSRRAANTSDCRFLVYVAF